MADTVALQYRCNAEEKAWLSRPRDARNGLAGERIGQRMDRAINHLCDEVEQAGFVIDVTNARERGSEKQHKARIQRRTLERLNAIVKRLPGVSRDQFVRTAIQRAQS